MSVEEALTEVMRQPPAMRAEIAEALLASLDETTDQVSIEWAAELTRRSREIAEGRVQTVAWEPLQTQILAEIRELRGSASSS
jgi:putative addiction module component (TIGR02574 family)